MKDYAIVMHGTAEFDVADMLLFYLYNETTYSEEEQFSQ
jgi:hypothetical protein